MIRVIALFFILAQTTPEGEALTAGYFGLQIAAAAIILSLALDVVRALVRNLKKVEISSF